MIPRINHNTRSSKLDKYASSSDLFKRTWPCVWRDLLKYYTWQVAWLNLNHVVKSSLDLTGVVFVCTRHCDFNWRLVKFTWSCVAEGKFHDTWQVTWSSILVKFAWSCVAALRQLIWIKCYRRCHVGADILQFDEEKGNVEGNDALQYRRPQPCFYIARPIFDMIFWNLGGCI